ncbi:hypothetical protein OG21DRAFT_1479946 [Imleria badia]|nr:hypothetical protein OG21DRAFT_1479946 [Imleria badia]
MTREIKFTSFGIPYILEFENVSCVPEPPRYASPSPSSSTSSFCYIDSPPPQRRLPSFSLRSPSSLFKRKPAPTPPTSSSRTSNNSAPELWCANSESTKPLPLPPQSDVPETHGIFIRSPPESSHPQRSRKEKLVHLQQTISVAVLDAGMSRSPGSTTRPEKHSNGNAVHGGRGYKTPDALFCGTYGQLMAALEGAGLSATPCAGENVSGYTRLGALFVARSDGASGLQLRKITLWG